MGGKQNIRITNKRIESNVDIGTKISAFYVLLAEYRSKPHILLISKRSDDDKDGTLVLPGGGRKILKRQDISGDGTRFRTKIPEISPETAEREVREEVGIEIDKDVIPLSEKHISLLPYKKMDIFAGILKSRGTELKKYLGSLKFDKGEVRGIYLLPLDKFREAQIKPAIRFYRKSDMKQISPSIDKASLRGFVGQSHSFVGKKDKYVMVKTYDKPFKQEDFSLIIGEHPKKGKSIVMSYVLEVLGGLAAAEDRYKYMLKYTAKRSDIPLVQLSVLNSITSCLEVHKTWLNKA